MAASTRSIHSRQRAAGGRSASSTSRLSLALSPAAARRGAHRPYSRNVGRPENSRAAPSATSRSNSRRAARPVIGAWRAASAGETQSSASRRSTILAAGFDRSLGATAMRVSERRERSAARSRAEAAASAIAPAAVFDQAGSPGLGRRPTSGGRSAGSRIFVAISGSGRGQRSRMAMARSNAQRARISASARWGVREGGERQSSGSCAAAETGSPLPAQAFRLAARPFGSDSQVEPRRRVGEPAGVEAGGRPARSRHSDKRFAAGPSGVANGEAQVAQRGFVCVDAQDLGGGGGALKRQAGAQRPGARRVAAQEGVEEREAGAGGEQGIALPCPSARPRPGRDRRWRGKACLSGAFAAARLRSRARPSGAGAPSPGSAGGLGTRVRIGANHVAHGESSAALCHLYFSA